jgi:hypothetical protein
MFEYERVVLSKNGFLLVYWKTRHSSYLYIPRIKQCIFKNAGFVLIPLLLADNVIVEVCNTWHKQKFVLELLPVNVSIEKPKELNIKIKKFESVMSLKPLNKIAYPVAFLLTADEPKFLLNQFLFSINKEAINFSNQNTTNDDYLLSTSQRQ